MGRTRRARLQREAALAASLNAAAEEGRRRGRADALRSAVSYVLGRETDEAARAAPGAPDTSGWASRWRAALSGPLRAVAEAAAPFSPRLASWLTGHTGDVSEKLAQTSRDNTERLLRDISGEGLTGIRAAEAFRERISDLNASRADLISEHQERLVSIEALDRAVEESGVAVRRFWSTQGDDRVRESHEDLEGEEAGEDGTWGGNRPGRDPGCRCSIRYEAGEAS